jgi:tetratricopeptide (TPR) repeat protein
MADSYVSTRDRLRHAQHRMFVGRRAEKQDFHDHALMPATPTYTVFAFHGIGGIGKTSLLAELELLTLSRAFHVASTTTETVHSPFDLMRAWRDNLPDKPFRKFDKELRRFTGVATKLHSAAESVGAGTLNAIQNAGVIGAFVAGAVGEERLRAFLSQHLSAREANIYIDGTRALTTLFVEACNNVARLNRVFLFLDHLEAATAELESWLRELVGGYVSTEIIFVLAGREPLRRMNPAWTTLRATMYERELALLSDGEVAEYFTKARITDVAVRREVASLAGGLPWALALSVETSDRGRPTVGGCGPGRGDVQSMVVNRFLSQIGSESAELRRAVESVSLVAWFDEELIRCLVQPSEELNMELLSRYSFIALRDDGRYTMRDAVREAVSLSVRQQREAFWRRTHRLAADYHIQRADEARPLGTAWRRHFLEVIRHTLEIDPAESIQIFVNTVERYPVQVWAAACGQALQSLESHDATRNEPRVLLFSAEALLAVNNVDAARGRFHQVTMTTAEPWPRLRAYAGLVDIAHRVGAVREALQLALTGHHSAEQADSQRDAAIFSARAAEMSGSVGDESGVDRYCARAEDHLLRCSDPFAAGQARLVMAYTQIFAGRYREGGTQLVRALEQWSQTGHAFGVAQVNSARSWVGWLTDQIAMGLQSARLAQDYFEEAQDHYHNALVALNLAELYRCSHQPALSIQWNQTAARQFAETGGVLYTSIAQYRLGRAQLDMGRVDDAIVSLETSVRLQEETVGERYSHGMALLYLAEALIAADRPNVASVIARAEEKLSGAQNRHGRAWAPVAAARLMRRLDPDCDTGDRLAQGLRLAREAGFWDVVGHAEAETALVLWRRGDDHELDTRAMDAIASAARHGPYCADRVMELLESLLSSLNAGQRSAALRRLEDGTAATASSGNPFAWDGLRRAEEHLNNAPIAERLRRTLLSAGSPPAS